MRAQISTSAVPVERLGVSAYSIPTDFPESDGTLEWDKTILVVVEASAGGRRGLGYRKKGVLIKTLMKEFALSKASIYRYLRETVPSGLGKHV